MFKLLQDKCIIPLDRICVLGSIGKGTALPNADFDCVVFMDKPIETLFDVLNDFEAILRPIFPELKKTRWSLQFHADGFDMDILPAVNFIGMSKVPPTGNPEVVRAQAWKVYEKILEAQSDVRGATASAYNTSLCESQVMFMKSQSVFTHQLVRLTKFWNKSLYIED